MSARLQTLPIFLISDRALRNYPFTNDPIQTMISTGLGEKAYNVLVMGEGVFLFDEFRVVGHQSTISLTLCDEMIAAVVKVDHKVIGNPGYWKRWRFPHVAGPAFLNLVGTKQTAVIEDLILQTLRRKKTVGALVEGITFYHNIFGSAVLS